MPDRTPAPARLKEKILRRIGDEPARVETDARGRIVAINPAFTELCGYTFPEIAGRKPGSFLQGKNTEAKAVEVLRGAFRKAEPCEVELLNYHKDGRPYRVHIRMEPIPDSSGGVSGFRAEEREVPAG